MDDKTIFSDLGIELKVPLASVDTIEIRFEKDVFTYQEDDFFRVVRRVEFDHFLAQIAKERGLNLQENEACIDIEYRDDGVIGKD